MILKVILKINDINKVLDINEVNNLFKETKNKQQLINNYFDNNTNNSFRQNMNFFNMQYI